MPTKPLKIEVLPQNPNCERCVLHESSKTVCVWGTGLESAEIVVIGEAPHSSKGPAEQLLRQVLADEGIENYYYTTSVKCRPADKIPNPSIKACKPYLSQELETIKPRFVLLLGATALKYIGKTGITELRGSTFDLGGIQYFCTFHPAAILRDPGKEVGFRADIAKFKRLTEGVLETGRKQRYDFVTPATEETFITQFRETEELAFDIETTGLQQHAEGFRVNSIGYTFSDDSTWVLPFHLPYKIGQTPKTPWATKLIKHTFELDKKKRKFGIGHNGKFDNMGIWHDFGGKYDLRFDTMLASHLFDENISHELKFLARIFCGAPEWDDLLLKEKLDPVGYNCLDKFYQYQAEDPYWTMQLYRYYRDKFKGTVKLRRLMNKLVMPIARVFEEIDYGGQFIRRKEFEKARVQLKKDIAREEQELWQLCREAGIKKKPNWGSPKQVGDILFNRLGLPIIERTPTGAPATGEATLIELQGLHPIGDKLIAWRGSQKQLNTYIEGWEELMIGDMLYLSTKLHGTVTGRYSSRLHQTPRDGTIRNLVDAPEPYTFAVADFSQIELRLVAHVAQEPTMLKIFREGGDIHRTTAMEVMMINREPTKEERKGAKGVNFGYVYGMWWKKFKKYAKTQYGVEFTDEQSRQFREAYFMRYFGLNHWHERMRDIVREQGYVESLSGRIRRLPGVFARDKDVRQEAERQAINTPIQGFGSGDLKAMAMLEIWEDFTQGQEDPDLILKGEVHDSILMWIKTKRLKSVIPKVKYIMENPRLFKDFNIKLSVPLIADIECGTWGLGVKYEPGEEKWEKFIKSCN
jgi:uracil-DNA glycosylase family 4